MTIDKGTALAKVLHYYGLLDGNETFKIVCPFHEDVNASLLVNLFDGSFYCFGCHASGDAMHFVKLVNKKWDDLHACIKYFRIIRSKKTKHLKMVKHEARIKNDVALNMQAHDYYYGLKTIDWYRESSEIKTYMQKRGFRTGTLNKCKAKINYNEMYPIIFPMFDMGVFRGWVCRTNNKRIEQKRKYLYNEGFSRRDTLVGNYSGKTVVLVEGYMDWLKMVQAGLNQVAAILGWKITQPQIEKLKKQGVTTIISALDTDSCGEKGTQYLKSFFKVVRFAFPEGIKDPGEMDKRQIKLAIKNTKKIIRRVQNGISKRH
jgi:DNA primase